MNTLLSQIKRCQSSVGGPSSEVRIEHRFWSPLPNHWARVSDTTHTVNEFFDYRLNRICHFFNILTSNRRHEALLQPFWVYLPSRPKRPRSPSEMNIDLEIIGLSILVAGYVQNNVELFCHAPARTASTSFEGIPASTASPYKFAEFGNLQSVLILCSNSYNIRFSNNIFSEFIT